MCDLKRLSGRDVVTVLSKFGFEVQSESRIHVKLRRRSDVGTSECITLALHDELDAATLRAIIEQASRFVSEHELLRSFSR